MPTLGLVALSAVVTLGLLVLVTRFDLATRTSALRLEAQVRRGTARLLREADRARRSS